MKNPFEKPPTSGEAESQEAEDEEKHEAHYIRHSKALYQTYGKILASEDPQQGFDPEEQVSPDLTPEGIELAQKKAEEFFDELDPEKDVVFLFLVMKREPWKLLIFIARKHIKGV